MASLTASTRESQVAEVRRALVDPVRVCERLGLGKGAQRQSGGGALVRCPVHAEKTPSCSVTRGPDGTIRAKCFGCDWSADVLGLVAAVRGLDTRRDFREVLVAAAELGGLHQLVDELRGNVERAERPLPPMPEPEPERDYPPLAEVAALWDSALPVAEVEPCAVALALRGLFPGPELVRAIPGDPSAPKPILDPVARRQSASPRWARYQGRSWLETGHRVLVPVYDPTGTMRSFRAWQVQRGAEGPKRLPPAGHRSSGLVLANERARSMLRDPSGTVRLLIAEGEPDHLSLCERYPGVAVIGVGSGSWSEAFAARVPLGSEVAVYTHHDEAGHRYAQHINSTLAKRAVLTRSKVG